MTAQALDDAQGTWYKSVAFACLAHVIALAAIQTLQHASPPARTLTTSVQLLAPRPAPVPPPPPMAADEPRPPEPPKAVPKARPKPTAQSAQPTPPPAAAPAPALLTAEPTPGRAAPMRFASDPHGQRYASGRVAQGGVAAVERVATGTRLQEEQVTPADQLQRQPLWNGGDCQGYFPEHAQVDQGRVSLIAVVRGDGSIARLDVSNETPPQSGFARAARACIMQRSFSPALGRDGRPTTARTQINLRFSR